jgi:hypothetical protein
MGKVHIGPPPRPPVGVFWRPGGVPPEPRVPEVRDPLTHGLEHDADDILKKGIR